MTDGRGGDSKQTRTPRLSVSPWFQARSLAFPLTQRCERQSDANTVVRGMRAGVGEDSVPLEEWRGSRFGSQVRGRIKTFHPFRICEVPIADHG